MNEESTTTEPPVSVDLGNIWDKIDAMIDGFFTILPNLAIAAVLLGVMLLAGRLLGRAVRGSLSGQDRDNLGEVLGSLLRWTIWIAGGMLAVTIVAPSVKPADLLGALGVGSVAIGFAFKDILQNMLAGVLILLRQPFEVGDQIVSGGHEGTVERIETRATMLKTYDGRRVVIPNSDIYTDAVVVSTAYPLRRSEYDVGIGYGDDVAAAAAALVEAMEQTEGVVSEPCPEVIVVALAGSSVNLRARWWTQSDKATQIHTFGRVLSAMKAALDEQAVDMPYPTQVVLFHDQTEASDGDRARQREGWPTGDSPPQSARISEALADAEPSSQVM